MLPSNYSHVHLDVRMLLALRDSDTAELYSLGVYHSKRYLKAPLPRYVDHLDPA